MNTTNLHDMPKDILIKLIATIREDTIEEISDKIFKETLQKVQDKFPGVYLECCSISNCKYFELSYNNRTHFLEECKRCGSLLCSAHLPANKDIKCCETCIKQSY